MPKMNRPLVLITILTCASVAVLGEEHEKDDEHGIVYPNSCEVCKYLAEEIEERVAETGKTHEQLKLGYSVDETKGRKIKYTTSELRIIEILENVCERMLNYNVHKERKDSTRLAKGMSQTFKTLHGLVDKGVKVELGIPHELWDKPSVEVTTLKTKCETMKEKYEDIIENWYFRHQDVPLKKFLCTDRILRKGDEDCLYEEPSSDKESENSSEPPKRKAKIEKVNPKPKSKRKEEL